MPTLFAYMKLMEEFSTAYVSCQSRFGYCLSTLKIAMDRINQTTLAEIVNKQRSMTMHERAKSYAITLKE